ncbi:MAG: beta-galactosidase, partial [Candidatus Latescibacteria bacterium]|nr:beta-galactosidase [Candidatus Latescibacterota bacterium]
RYKELADAGFTHSFTHFPDAETVAKALDIAKAAGIKLLVRTPELKTDPEGTVKRFKDHPALAGYNIRDEPNVKDFPDLAEQVKRIRAVDDEHICYINLFPSRATPKQLGTETYREHVDLFVKTVPIKLLSFDHYPITVNGLRPEWSENLEIISEVSRDTEKPFWAFALSLAHRDYPIPSIDHLRLQVFCNLAYGAQGIQYYRYWTPKSTKWDFHDGPIDINGKRTVVYDRVKKVNEEIRNLSGIFVGAKVLHVGRAGNITSIGTKPSKIMSPFTNIDIIDQEAIVSWLENGNRKYLMIVNFSLEGNMMLHVGMQSGSRVKRVDKNGSFYPIDSLDYDVIINPGDTVIFTWTDN